MRILLTGAAGFIGSHLGERLARDHEVVGVDNFEDYYDPAIKERNAEAFERAGGTILRLDAREEDFVKHFQGERFDAVAHLAAKVGVRPSLSEPKEYYQANVEGTLNALETARATDASAFLFASSSSIYGDRSDVPFRETDRVDKPISPYAATKKAGELLVHTYAHLYGLRTACLRFFTVYGERQRPDLAIAKFARLIENDEPIPLFGDGSSKRDYTYVGDVVEGVVGCLEWLRERPAGKYDVFNIGESRTVALRELVSELERALGKKAKIDRRERQLGDVKETFADVSKAAETFGYKPTTTISEGIAKYVEHLRAVEAEAK
ncbi:MAG: NAD-dependent epimerase/dehydratase family protein [Ignavibacteriales bacterium]|nr:NAD-dependent epimerase/dehydratase family protein [Ignavibacteriales bacterium]